MLTLGSIGRCCKLNLKRTLISLVCRLLGGLTRQISHLCRSRVETLGDDFMVSALVCGSSGLGSSPG